MAVPPADPGLLLGHQLSRRDFLRAAGGLGGALLSPGLLGLSACSDSTTPLPRAPDYGPLRRSTDVPELWIPEGFTVRRLSTSGSPSTVNPGLRVGYALDGMGAFARGGGAARLVRNHEVRDGAGRVPLLGPGARRYDPTAGGGTTTLEVRLAADGAAELAQEVVSLSGTLVNCAGGATPWGTWITCEETTAGKLAGYHQEHGYCFEVLASADEEVEPVPLRGLGRFVHEAVAVDPRDWTVYLTEDRLFEPTTGRGAGFYRFLPAVPGRLASGGQLQMLAVRDAPRFLTVRGQRVLEPRPATWVPIDQPDPPDAETNPSAVFEQGYQRGGAVFQRLEGCWYGDGNVYFNATLGGDAGLGQVWAYRPTSAAGGTLTLIFESRSREVLDSPDNLCVSPRGGLVLCEDGEGVQFLRGLTPAGTLFDLVRTDGESTEFAGACFSPQGRTLFFNRQGATRAEEAAVSRGATYALWGPWERGSL